MNRENILNDMQDFISVDLCRIEKTRREKIEKISKSACTLLLCILSIAGIVCAKDISNKVYTKLETIGTGMEHAIQKGYVAYPSMEFNISNSTILNARTGEKVQDAQTSIKVDEIIMDDFNISITFNVNLSDETLKVVKAEDIWNMHFSDMVITDENDNILYSAKKLADTESLNAEINTFISERDGNTLKVVYNLYTKADTDAFPKSKELNIKFANINISKDAQANTLLGEGEINLSGDWNLKVDIPEKMYNRNAVVYTQATTTDNDFNVTKAVLYDTGMEIEVEVADVNQDKKSYSDVWNRIFDIDVVLENENSEIFEEIVGPVENGSKDIDDEGTLTYDAMYDLTKYDETDEITVKVTRNEKEASIVLVKEEN
jgi:hypothetical protein